MDEWDGNNEIFRTYVKGQPGKKAPTEKVKGREQISTFADVREFSDFGGILNENIIDISFDDSDMAEKFLDMAEVNEWRCMALQDPENGHIHTFWKDSLNKIKKLSSKDQKLSCGFVADIHGGNTYIPLRMNNVDRFPPVYDVLKSEEYQEVPEELLPVTTKIDLWGLKEGNRNDALSRMAKYLVHQTVFQKDVIIRILTNTNRFVFADSLPDSEMKIILRDETFEGNVEVQPLDTLNAANLLKMDIKPVEFVINGLIPVGLSILASPPKYGKSWMCLDMAISVATGQDFLGFTTNQCGVFYLSLEDRFDRLKQRMIQITGKEASPEQLELAIDSATLGDGFIEQLTEFLKDHPGTKLIIIDTFIKVRGEPKRNESAYSVDSREAGILKSFADLHDIAIVLVTHTRKGIDPNDPFVNITGTYGVAGAADDMIVLTKEKRNDQCTKMSVTGRDVQYEDYAIIFDSEKGKWIRQADAYDDFIRKEGLERDNLEYMISDIRKTIVKLLEENEGKWEGNCATIIKKSKEYGTPINLTSQKLGKKLSVYTPFMYKDKIVHTEVSRGNDQSKKHKFEKVEESEKE